MKYPAETVWVVTCFVDDGEFCHFAPDSMRVFKKESDARKFYLGVMENAERGEAYEISEEVVF